MLVELHVPKNYGIERKEPAFINPELVVAIEPYRGSCRDDYGATVHLGGALLNVIETPSQIHKAIAAAHGA